MEDSRITFKGSTISLFSRSLLNAVIFLFLLSYCFFDLHGMRVYFAAIVLLVPILLVLVSQNRFWCDDDAKEIVKPLRKNIPYHAIRSISVRESGKNVAILAGTGGLRRDVLIEALPKSEKDRVIDELVKRFPDVPLKEGGTSIWKILVGAEIVIILACLIVNGYLYEAYPQIKTIPDKAITVKEGMIDYRLKKYAAGDLTFRLPRIFELFSELSNGYMFNCPDRETRMRVIYGTYDHAFGSKRKYIEKATGLNGIYEFYRVGYYARFGIVPLVFKAMMIGRTETPKIVPIEHDDYKGFIMEGEREGQNYAHILIEMKNTGKDVHFFLLNSKPDNERLIKILLESIRSLKH